VHAEGQAVVQLVVDGRDGVEELLPRGGGRGRVGRKEGVSARLVLLLLLLLLATRGAGPRRGAALLPTVAASPPQTPRAEAAAGKPTAPLPLLQRPAARGPGVARPASILEGLARGLKRRSWWAGRARE